MNSRPLAPASDVCLACRYRLANSRRRIDLAKVIRDGVASPPGSRLPTRTLHDTRVVCLFSHPRSMCDCVTDQFAAPPA